MSDVDLYWNRVLEKWNLQPLPFNKLSLNHQNMMIHAINLQLQVLDEISKKPS